MGVKCLIMHSHILHRTTLVAANKPNANFLFDQGSMIHTPKNNKTFNKQDTPLKQPRNGLLFALIICLFAHLLSKPYY